MHVHADPSVALLGFGVELDLDAPASRYLDDLPPAWRDVRVHQLLAHTSGLPDIIDAQGLVGGGSEATAWQLVEQQPMQALPGARFAYNQTNYVLLARIIAKQSQTYKSSPSSQPAILRDSIRTDHRPITQFASCPNPCLRSKRTLCLFPPSHLLSSTLSVQVVRL